MDKANTEKININGANAAGNNNGKTARDAGKNKNNGRKKHQWSIFMTVALFFAILIILIALYIIIIGNIERKKMAKEQAERKIVRLSSQMETFFGNIESFYSIALESSDVEAVLKTPAYYNDSTMMNRLTWLIGGADIYDGYVFEFVFVDTEAGKVLTDSDVFDKSEFPSYNEYRELLSNKSKSRYWKASGTGFVNYVVKLPLGSAKQVAVLDIGISINKLKTDLADVFTGVDVVAVLDESGKIAISSEPAEKYAEIENIILNNAGKDTIRVKGLGKCFVRTEKSKITGLEYVIITPRRGMMNIGDASSFFGAIALILTAILVFGVAVYVTYRPIYKLFKTIDKAGEVADDADKPKNEIALIEKHFMNLSEDKDTLKKTVSRQQNSIQQMFELHLLNDGIRSEDEWNDYFENLNLPKYEVFATAVAVLDVRYDSHVQTAIDEDAICLQLIEDMPDSLREYLWMPPVYNSCTVFGLIGAKDEDELFEKVNKYYEGMQKYCNDMTGLYIIMGVSGTHSNHRHIRRAYRESALALMYNENTEEDYQEREARVLENGADTSKSLRFYVDKMLTREGPSGFEAKYENEVYLNVKEADTYEAYKCTDRFSEFLLTVNTPDDALYYIIRYADHILMAAKESNIAIEEIFPQGMRLTYRELISELEPRRIRVFMKQRFIDPVINCMNEHMQNKSNQVMKMIDDLLDETHGNILLSECADRLNLNQNYIWKVLKMERGKGFTEYAEKRKIEEAKKLLLEKNLSVQDIAVTLGYANAQNFIRFFSKATGITPGKFRKMY